MASKDSFDAFISILRDKIDAFSENASQPNVKIIQNELKDKFDDLAKSQGYVSNDEYEALKELAKRLEQRVSRLEELLESKTKITDEDINAIEDQSEREERIVSPEEIRKSHGVDI